MGDGRNASLESRTFLSRPVFAGVCLLSKLSQLKQDAYQAGKKKDWDQAVSIYEKILELEKNNPTVINEMGDLCLKAGESSRAVSHFLTAASKYRKTGLLNNAVAIYKKILRHDEENLNAHWYLAETRASQGLVHEGEQHGLKFLTNSENVSGELKEIFLNRCRELFELYPESLAIQEHLLKVFRTWDMNLEAARSLCLLAAIQFNDGHEEQARTGMEEVTSRTPEIVNYPEYTKWNNLANPTPGGSASGAFQDFGEVDLGGGTGAPDTDPAAAPVDAPAAAAPSADETSFGELQIEVEKINAEVEDDGTPVVEIPVDEPVGEIPVEDTTKDPMVEIPDDDGCFSLDTGDEASFDDLIAQAASQVAATDSETEGAPPAEEIPQEPAAEEADHSQTGEVDLLAEILAEDSEDTSNSDADQLTTITQEIGVQVGGEDGDDDAGRQYEMGLVYLEMGLFDQSCASLEKATQDDEFALRAFEMWGVALCRSNRPDDAVKVLTDGLGKAESGSQQQLGLLYHIGKAHEQAGRIDQARDFYGQIQEQDRSFLDVGKCLAALPSA